MDLRKLLKSATEAVSNVVENSKPKNPQDDAIADLVARDVKFEAKDLTNLFFSAGGGYGGTIKGEDIKRLQTARALFGHLKNSPPAEVVGYLTPDPTGTVTIVVNGNTVDRLTKQSAKLVLQKISTPTPVKIEVSIIPNRDPKFDRPHLKLKRDTKPPKS